MSYKDKLNTTTKTVNMVPFVSNLSDLIVQIMKQLLCLNINRTKALGSLNDWYRSIFR